MVNARRVLLTGSTGFVGERVPIMRKYGCAVYVVIARRNG